jgi:hypothetical protein
MAANQRVGIISKYAKNLGLLPMQSMPTPMQPGGSYAAQSSYATPFPSAVAAAQSFTSGVSTMFSSQQSSGGYGLQFLFFLFLYGFILFLLLILIHYTIRPMFQFVPGGKGIIPISTSYDYNKYWTTGEQPTATDIAPKNDTGDTLRSAKFHNKYSASVDIFIENPSSRTGLDRLIFYTASTASAAFNPTTFAFNNSKTIPQNMVDSAPSVCMVCYLAEKTNDLVVTYILKNGAETLQQSSLPIQNIPLYTPFRLTIVYNTNIFTVYLNGVQVSQTSVGGLTPRTSDSQIFYANTRSTKCAYVQTLLLWDRPITYNELAALPVALTAKAKFSKTPIVPVPSAGACSAAVPAAAAAAVAAAGAAVGAVV